MQSSGKSSTTKSIVEFSIRLVHKLVSLVNKRKTCYACNVSRYSQQHNFAVTVGSRLLNTTVTNANSGIMTKPNRYITAMPAESAGEDAVSMTTSSTATYVMSV